MLRTLVQKGQPIAPTSRWGNPLWLPLCIRECAGVWERGTLIPAQNDTLISLLSWAGG